MIILILILRLIPRGVRGCEVRDRHEAGHATHDRSTWKAIQMWRSLRGEASGLVSCHVVRCGIVTCAARCSAVQRSTAQCSAAQCSAVQHSATQCSEVQRSAAKCSEVQRSAGRGRAGQCSAIVHGSRSMVHGS